MEINRLLESVGLNHSGPIFALFFRCCVGKMLI